MTRSLDPNHLQQVRNLALLARQAIANGDATMSASPRMVADACLAFDAVLAGDVSSSLDNVSSGVSAPVDQRVAALSAILDRLQDTLSEAHERAADIDRELATALRTLQTPA